MIVIYNVKCVNWNVLLCVFKKYLFRPIYILICYNIRALKWNQQCKFLSSLQIVLQIWRIESSMNNFWLALLCHYPEVDKWRYDFMPSYHNVKWLFYDEDFHFSKPINFTHIDSFVYCDLYTSSEIPLDSTCFRLRVLFPWSEDRTCDLECGSPRPYSWRWGSFAGSR